MRAYTPSPERHVKRRAAAVSRLVVATDECGAAASTASPQPLGSGRREHLAHTAAAGSRAGAGKQQQLSQQLDRLLHTLHIVLLLGLAASLGGALLWRHARLQATSRALQQRYQDEMSLQVELLAVSMSEHSQCQAALAQADADYKTARAGLQQCTAAAGQLQRHATSSSSAAQLQQLTGRPQHAVSAGAISATSSGSSSAEQLRLQLEATSKELQAVRASLASAEWQVQALQTQQQQQQQQQQGLWRHSSAAAGETVVLVMCDDSTVAPGNDVMKPWAEAAVLAGLQQVLVATQSAVCERTAAEAGLQVVKHDLEVPSIPGSLSGANARAYARYAAMQRVLQQGRAVLSVAPDVLLLADPLPLLQRYATDVSVMSLADWDEGDLAYGRLLSLGGAATSTTKGAAAAAGTPATAAAAAAATEHRHHMSLFATRPVSTGLLHLRPGAGCLQLLETMLAGLARGDAPEAALLNELLLTLHHLPPDTTHGSSSSIGGSSGSSSSSSSAEDGSSGGGSRQPPARALTVGVLPLQQFTSSAAVADAPDAAAWLQQHKPLAIQVLPPEASSSLAAAPASSPAAGAAAGGGGGSSRPSSSAALMEELLVSYWAGQPGDDTAEDNTHLARSPGRNAVAQQIAGAVTPAAGDAHLQQQQQLRRRVRRHAPGRTRKLAA